jgi:hypothetical protein
MAARHRRKRACPAIVCGTVGVGSAAWVWSAAVRETVIIGSGDDWLAGQ